MGDAPRTSSQASPPLASFTSLGARSWNLLGRYLVHMSGASTTCPSAEIRRYARATAPPSRAARQEPGAGPAGPTRSLTFVSAYFWAPGAGEAAPGPGETSITPELGGAALGEGLHSLTRVGRRN